MRLIVGFPAGNASDLFARLTGQRLSERLGQSFVVENRPGAGGTLGTADVAAAEPDGYTLLSAQPGPLTTHVLLYRNLRFDPAALEPVIMDYVKRVSGRPAATKVRELDAKLGAEHEAAAKAAS